MNMTDKEKAKAYDEAIKVVKPLYEQAKKDDCPIWSTYEYIFPELAESEDERIRKWIYNLVECIGYPADEEAEKEIEEMQPLALAWLEKQKEGEKEVAELFDSTDSYNKGFRAGQEKTLQELKEHIKEDKTQCYAYDAGYAAGFIVGKEQGWKEHKAFMKENPKSANSIPADCTSNAKCEDRWYKVQDSLPADGRLVLAKDNIGNYLLASFAGGEWFVERYDLDDVPMKHTYVTEWCEIPSEKQKEQKCNTIIKGWIARDKALQLNFYTNKPKRGKTYWIENGGDSVQIVPEPENLYEETEFDALTWEDEPIEVELLVKRKEQKEQKPAESISQLTVQGKGVYKICPRCKERMVRDDSMVYTSMPPQYRYECPKCGESECDTVMYDNPEMEEQKPEWSDTDNIGWDEAFACVTQAEKSAKNEEELQNAVTAEKWLKEIKFKYYVHPVKQEWSEEDERMRQSLILHIGGYTYFAGIDSEKVIAWLKSLKPQDYPLPEDTVLFNKGVQEGRRLEKEDMKAELEKEWKSGYNYAKEEMWKPSEEQIIALKNVAYGSYVCGDGPALRSLFENLKKLKEE